MFSTEVTVGSDGTNYGYSKGAKYGSIRSLIGSTLLPSSYFVATGDKLIMHMHGTSNAPSKEDAVEFDVTLDFLGGEVTRLVYNKAKKYYQSSVAIKGLQNKVSKLHSFRFTLNEYTVK